MKIVEVISASEVDLIVRVLEESKRKGVKKLAKKIQEAIKEDGAKLIVEAEDEEEDS